jgi:hypothetical protein
MERGDEAVRFIAVFVIILSLLIPSLAAPRSGSTSKETETENMPNRVAKLEKKVEEISRYIGYVTDYGPYILGAIVAALSFGATISTIRQGQRDARKSREERASADHIRQREQELDKRHADHENWYRGVMEVYKRGEEAAQTRASDLHDKLFTKSADTLGLVNATLTLTKEASERALKANEDRVGEKLQQLDGEIKTFLRPFANKDSRNLVNNQIYRDNLKQIVMKLESLELNNEFLAKPVSVSPYFKFVKALSYYLSQLPEETIDALQKLSNQTIDDVDLKIRVFYWLGFEQNNVGDFVGAENSFTNAINLASGKRRLMLNRLLIETLLYNTTNKPQSLINNIDKVIKEDENFNDLDNEDKVLVLITKCNVLYAAALEAYENKQIDLAKEFMEGILYELQPVTSSDKQAKRDFAIASIILGKNMAEMKDSLNGEVKLWAQEMMSSQINPRLKAMYNFTQIIIAKITESSALDGLTTRSSQLVSDVHKKYTIYSPLRKRNVSQEEFRDDVRKLVREGLPNLS